MGKAAIAGAMAAIFVAQAGCTTYEPFKIVEFPDKNTNLFLQGAKGWEEINMIKLSEQAWPSDHRTLALKGHGAFSFRGFRVEFDEMRISVNGRRIQINGKMAPNYVLGADGAVT